MSIFTRYRRRAPPGVDVRRSVGRRVASGLVIGWVGWVGVLAIVAWVFGLVSIPVSASASASEPERPTIVIGWTQNPPTIDGRIDPTEWIDAAQVEGLTQALPDEGAPATERTEVFIMTDEDHLYIAARLWDSQPERIVANEMSRDGDTGLDDRFGFTIDPFLDRQNGYFFQANVNGARKDMLIEGNSFSDSWDGRWYAKTSRDAQGWSVEIALPYRSINFDPEADVWGFNMARGMRRRDEIDRWADPSRERFLTAMGRAGNLVGMRGVRQGLGLQLIPAATIRRVDDNVAPPPRVDNRERHYTKIDPSFDAFYKITPSVTTALTVNTDFGETEVDERRVNLSRFALFFPEKRDFFLQDALIFDFGDLSENGRPFFSRRIGLNQNGKPEDILAGGKVTGRVGDVKFGVLDIVLDEHDRVDQQNLVVARAAVNVGESTVGAIVTHGEPEANGSNTVVGADFLYRNSNFRDNKTLRASVWAQGSVNDPDDGPTADPNAIDGLGYAFGGAISYPNDRHQWELFGRVFDDDFDPALGFVNRVGIREYGANYRRRWRPDSPLVQTIDTRLDGAVITEQGRQIESGSFIWRAIELRNPVADGFLVEYQHRYEAVDRAFSNFTVPIGRYHFDETTLRLFASQNRRLGGELLVGYGSFFDGMRLRTLGDVTFRFSKHVQTGLIYSYDNLRLPNGDENIHLVRARLSLFFTPNVSWVTLVQYDSVSDRIGVNSRFRWIIEDGRELFLVVNQGFETRDDLVATRTAPLAKLQWTLRF